MQIVIPFAQVTALNPNLPNRNLSSTLESYFKCIAVSCHSFRSNNPDMKILLITNLDIEGETNSILKALNVEIVISPFTFNPPAEFGDTFRGCFYFFDALRMLKEDSLIIDPDVICLGNLKDMSDGFDNKIAVFNPNFHPDKLINGISPSAAVDIFRGYKKDYKNRSPKHVGGEAIFFPKDSISKFTAEVSRFWDWNVLQAETKLRFLPTEEHIITCIIGETDCDSLSRYISRIWTTRSYKDIEGDEQDPNRLILWHLPSEKNKGFRRIYDTKIKSNDNLCNLKLTKHYYANVMNLYPNFGARTLYRVARKLKS
jgi:hypothetical protein